MVNNKAFVKKFSILFFALVLVGLFAWFVLAAAGDTMKIRTPLSGSNFTYINGTQLFNVTFVNGTDISLGLGANATFLLNISGVWTNIGNASCNVGANNNGHCAFNITNTTIPEGVYSLNATISNGTTNVNVSMAGNLTGPIIIDHTGPQVQAANFSATFFNGANLSTAARGSNYTLNVSIYDAVIGIQTVYLNITNSSGGQNQTFTLTREGSTNQFISLNLNTSQFPDGEYNLTVYANDSLGNSNSSAVVQRVIFDKTEPSLSFSCSPSSVEEGEVVTCSCTATDATSGVNSSYGVNGVSFTASPSTTQTGSSFVQSCTGQDKAGNLKTMTTTYAVSGSSSSSSGTTGATGATGATGTGSSSGGTASPVTNASSGNIGPDSGNDSLEQVTGNIPQPSSSGFGIGWIIAIILIVVAVVIVVMMNKRKQ